MRMVFGLVVGASLLVGGWVTPGDPSEPSDLSVTNPEVRVQYGIRLDLHAELRLPPEETAHPQTVYIYLQPTGVKEPVQDEVTLQPTSTSNSWLISYSRDLSLYPLPAFDEVTYWFAIPDSGGDMLTSPKFTFEYVDNRKAWQGLAAPPFRVFWYEGPLQIGEDTLIVAQNGLNRVQQILPLPAPGDVRIYAYPSREGTLAAIKSADLNGSGMENIDPARSVILVTIPPEAESSQGMPRVIPHALLHILLYNDLGEYYHNLPVWLVEGLAEMAEPYPDPHDVDLLQNAYTRNTLIPMDALCRAFPQDPSGSSLAAAQASSFMQYLIHRYGVHGVERLMDSYRRGEECERGVSLAFGSSLAQLQDAWQDDAFHPIAPETQSRLLSPWLFLLILLILAPIGMLVFRSVKNRKIKQ